MSEFPGVTKQARGIARLYKWLGVYSIPLLTVVTVISISNVFTRGQLASASWLQTLWAIIFAIAIEVNIIRLFFEAKLDQDRGALLVGIGLTFVAGAALLIEGLQQSIGFAWSNVYIQWAIGIVVALRVLLVVVLMAREGSKLASAVVDSKQVIYACPVNFHAQEPIQEVVTPPEQSSIQEPITEAIQPVTSEVNMSSNVVAFTNKPTSDKKKRVQRLLKSNPDASLSEIAKKAGVSRGYVSQIRSDTAKMQAVKFEQEPHVLNGTHSH